jgi:DNA-binding CsgD family transcriptional regulator
MTNLSLSENFPNGFQRQALDLINGLLPLTSSGFYLVGADMHHSGVVLRNLDTIVERDYERNYRDQDPLNPALFAHSDDRVVCIDEQLTESELLQSDYYREFMLPLKHRHVADMFLRRDRDIVAVLTMLRAADLGPFSQGELALVGQLQPFIQYSLNTVYLPKRYRERDSVQQTYQLTDRELDVVELIVTGASNKLIARQLGLSLATVKTHIQHIFQKVSVASRTELSALVLRDLPG